MSAARGDEDDEWIPWGAEQARAWVCAPGPEDDKYSRGVLGVLTGSERYPGAAVLGVEAAARTGVGMVRYLGSSGPAGLVLARRPETVTASGRVQAWLIGSGTSAEARSREETVRARGALGEGLPTVLDAGGLDLLDWVEGPVVLTPHYRELARMLVAHGVEVSAEVIAREPVAWAVRAAALTGMTVLLKGSPTVVAGPSGPTVLVTAGPAWLATAGTGDVLGGVLGALLATNAARLAGGDDAAVTAVAASAAVLHGLAAERACAGGPITALDVAEALPATVAALLASRPAVRPV